MTCARLDEHVRDDMFAPISLSAASTMQTIDGRVAFDSFVERVKTKMVLVNGVGVSRELREAIDNTTAAEAERAATAISSRDVYGNQPWVAKVRAGTVVFVVDSVGELRGQLKAADLTDPTQYGEILDDLFLDGMGNAH